MRGSFLLLAATAMLSLAAYGEDAPLVPASVPSSTEQTSDLDQVICKQQPPPVGSRLGSRTVCQTRKHWLELETDSQDALLKAQKSSGMPAGSGK